ncbi:MAG: hypothetical protein OXB86_04400, partial [Bdellovibrionales bacterium]|nr:hypothetical protein [Bdellovibrionales bacterium]
MTGLIAFFSFLLTFFTFFQAQADEWETYGTSRTPASTGYTCRIDSDCLDHLHNTLLNKQSPESVYSICEEVHNRNKNCCLNPSGCNAPYAEGSNLKENSYSFFQQHGGNATSCQLNNLSGLMSGLSQLQNNFCSNGKIHCQEMCKNKQEELRRVFKDCFSVEDRYSINHVLEKAKNPTSHHDCYKEVRNVAEIYKRQSRNQTALFKDHLKSQDIVDCSGIGKEKATSNLNSLAVNICQQAQKKKQEVEAKQIQTEITPQEVTTKPEAKLGSENLSSGPGNNQSGNEIEGSGGLGSEALLGTAGAAAGALALKKSLRKDNKGSSQNKGFENANLRTASKRARSQGNKGSSRTRNATRQNISSRGTERTTPTAGSGHLSGSKTKSSTSKPLQLAESRISVGKCPVHVPKIKSAVVFQSVMAPQIEPMNEQKHPPYDNYELVMGKRAGILVKLEKGFRENKSFSLNLYIRKKFYHSKCFHKPFSGNMIYNQLKDCGFSKRDLERDGYYKFLLFPMGKPIKKVPVTVVLASNTYHKNKNCRIGKNFRVSIVKTPKLKLGFARIDGGQRCSTNYNPSSQAKVREFVNSDEVKKYIPAMFPVSGISAEILLTENNRNSIPGSCNKRLADPANKRSTITIGMLRDISTLEEKRALGGYSKIFAIVPRSYFKFHNEPKTTRGLFLHPYRKELKLFSRMEFGPDIGRGSWNVAFVRDNAKNVGTVAHELAHSLGQEREFYKPQEQCRTFRGSNLEPCKDYKIPISLRAWFENGQLVFKLIRDKFSVVNNKGNITNRWIDRDTYQKTFAVLAEKGAIIPEDEYLYREKGAERSRVKKSSLKAIVSGFYYKRTDSFLVP